MLVVISKQRQLSQGLNEMLRKKESEKRERRDDGGKIKKYEEVLVAQGEYPYYKEYCRLCTFSKMPFFRSSLEFILRPLWHSSFVFLLLSLSAPICLFSRRYPLRSPSTPGLTHHSRGNIHLPMRFGDGKLGDSPWHIRILPATRCEFCFVLDCEYQSNKM